MHLDFAHIRGEIGPRYFVDSLEILGKLFDDLFVEPSDSQVAPLRLSSDVSFAKPCFGSHIIVFKRSMPWPRKARVCLTLLNG